MPRTYFTFGDIEGKLDMLRGSRPCVEIQFTFWRENPSSGAAG
jgi:hypothetical protein